MKDSFILYTENKRQIDLLSREQKGDLLDAIFAYAEGHDPEGLDALTEMAFSFIQSRMDRDAEKWEETREKRAEAGRAGGIKSGETRSKAKQSEANEANEANASSASENEANEANEAVPVPVPVPVPVSSKGVGDKGVREPRHKHGEYQHVLLTDREYARLCDDYGQQATDRAIRKVDEYCQETGKRYKDYNLTLRRWGFDETNKPQAPPRQVRRQTYTPFDFERKDNNLDEVQRMLAKQTRQSVGG